MKENTTITIDEYEKVVTDLFLYIEKEADFQFEYNELGGSNKMITIESCNSKTPSISCPAELYSLNSYNYCVCFVIYVCEFEGRKKIIEIALLPFNSESDETFINATEKLTEILPDIPITHHLRKSENVSY